MSGTGEDVGERAVIETGNVIEHIVTISASHLQAVTDSQSTSSESSSSEQATARAQLLLPTPTTD